MIFERNPTGFCKLSGGGWRRCYRAQRNEGIKASAPCWQLSNRSCRGELSGLLML